MGKTDDMFKELGYVKEIDNDTEVIYFSKEKIRDEDFISNIHIAKIGKVIFSYGNKRDEVVGIGLQELKAINEKVKELGWNN